MGVKYSEHLAIMQRCGHGIFGIGVLKSSTSPSREPKYKKLESLFIRAGIFEDTPMSMDSNAVWRHVNFDKKTLIMEADNSKAIVPFTTAEQELERVFFNLSRDEAVPAVETEEGGDREDKEEGALGNAETEVGQLEMEEERVAALKKLSTVKKYEFHSRALEDMAVVKGSDY
jgi:hypothetical protein